MMLIVDGECKDVTPELRYPMKCSTSLESPIFDNTAFADTELLIMSLNRIIGLPPGTVRLTRREGDYSIFFSPLYNRAINTLELTDMISTPHTTLKKLETLMGRMAQYIIRPANFSGYRHLYKPEDRLYIFTPRRKFILDSNKTGYPNPIEIVEMVVEKTDVSYVLLDTMLKIITQYNADGKIKESYAHFIFYGLNIPLNLPKDFDDELNSRHGHKKGYRRNR